MLFSAMKMPRDLFDTDDDDDDGNKETSAKSVASTAQKTGTPVKPEDDDEADWDGGLEIAEQLVKQLQKRRLSDASSVAAH